MKQAVCALALLLAATGICGQAKTTSMNDKETVLQLHRQLLAAIAGKQETVMQEGIREGFLFTSANGDVLDKRGFINGFAMSPAIRLPLFAPSEQQVVMAGHTAVVTAVVHINIVRGNDSPKELWERITETYVQEAGQWKLMASQATYMQPPAR